MLLAAEGDYRKVGNGTTTRALRFVSILKSHHSSNRSHQGHGKRRKASGRSCLSAFATAFTTAGARPQEYALLQLPAGMQKLVRAACRLAHAAPKSDERRY